MTPISIRTKLFVAFYVALGVAGVIPAFAGWHCSDVVRFACYLLVALLASGLKVALPGVNGTMSVNFLFILICLLELSIGETFVIGCAAAIVQTYWNARKRPRPIHVMFNAANMSVAITIAHLVFRTCGRFVHHSLALELFITGIAYFIANTVPLGVVISISEHKNFRKVWSECYFWSFPYYLVGAGIAGGVDYVNSRIGWEVSLLVLPAMYVIYRSYRLYLGRLEAEKDHVAAIAELHMRTIEALALAIEAKDHTTHEHLQRVRVYAVELGKEMGLPDMELEALRAAALLHDIGKLGVPEHILNKPGRLTAAEFEKMKIHPIVGAEILARVSFPYPVVPIVRAHHENWDGSGYPDGLSGEEIPIGARILAAIDCFDAMASDRQYRKALPLPKAMAWVESESGKKFDPRVVETLKRRYLELEEMAQGKMDTTPEQVAETNNHAVPAAGLQEAAPTVAEPNFLLSIAAARQEAQTLFELTQELGNSLSLDDTLSVLSMRLRKLVPFDTAIVYVSRDGSLVAQHVSGDNIRLFSSMTMPIGTGVSGWVAQTGKPIINGNPTVEPNFPDGVTLSSSLSVPLEGVNEIVGVLTLYSSDQNAYSADHLRILAAISSKVALSIGNAMKFQQASDSATIDYLTGLPNARSLFLHIEGELSRCKREDRKLTVMVCDLDGFKQVNDRFGHLVGNEVLQSFGHKLKLFCREYDYVARMGGDEFVIVAPGMQQEGADAKAEVLQQLAREAGRQATGEELLSVSVGVAFFPEHGSDAERLLSEADHRMYAVKQKHHADREIVDPRNQTAFLVN